MAQQRHELFAELTASCVRLALETVERVAKEEIDNSSQQETQVALRKVLESIQDAQGVLDDYRRVKLPMEDAA